MQRYDLSWAREGKFVLYADAQQAIATAQANATKLAKALGESRNKHECYECDECRRVARAALAEYEKTLG